MRISLAPVAAACLSAVLGTAAPLPAQAQYLGPFLDAQRSNNIRMHQQRMIQRSIEQRRARQAPRHFQAGPDVRDRRGSVR